MSVAQTEALKRYARSVRETLRGGPTNVEQALAPSFKNLIDDLLPTLVVGQGLTTLPEYANDFGRPDIALVRQGQLPRAFFELKAPDKHLEPTRWRDAHDRRQFARFCELPIWALSNFGGIRFFQRADADLEVSIVPPAALDPLASDSRADAAIDAHDSGPFIEILSQLAQAQPPTPSNAAQLAEFLAHAARLVRASVIENLGQLDAARASGRPLQLVREEFRDVLYAHPESGHLPDRHSFRGSYGGYAFPLYDRRPGHGPTNLRSELIEGLSLAYHAPVEPQDIFDAILGLLSATSYTLRFAEDLEDVFPHIPFPADRQVFDRAATIGRTIRELETFARAPAPAFLTAAVARIETTPHGTLAAIRPGDWDAGNLILCSDGNGRVSGIPAAVWAFAVSGYRVLPRWLAGREGVPVDDAFIREFRDITGRINELIHHFDEADLVLQDALTHTLTKGELGL